MDYKYIEQLLERYWMCQTSLEEEEILRSFFSQKDVPAELQQYKELFVYALNQKADSTLGSDFDDKILSLIGEPVTVKARKVKMPQLLMPLFKAAAVVAIILTLSNALQMSFHNNDAYLGSIADTTGVVNQGTAVAIGDSVVRDTMLNNVKMGVEPKPAGILK